MSRVSHGVVNELVPFLRVDLHMKNTCAQHIIFFVEVAAGSIKYICVFTFLAQKIVKIMTRTSPHTSSAKGKHLVERSSDRPAHNRERLVEKAPTMRARDRMMLHQVRRALQLQATDLVPVLSGRKLASTPSITSDAEVGKDLSLMLSTMLLIYIRRGNDC